MLLIRCKVTHRQFNENNEIPETYYVFTVYWSKRTGQQQKKNEKREITDRNRMLEKEKQ